MGTDTDNKLAELEKRLSNEEELPGRIDLLTELAWEVRDIDPDRSRDLSEDAYELSTSGPYDKEPYPRGLIMSLRGLAHANRRAGNLELSLSQSTIALQNLKSNALPAVEVDILRNTAIVLGLLGNYPEGLEYGFRALATAETIGDRQREAEVVGSLGVIYLHSRNFTEAKSMLRRSLELDRSLGNRREEGLALNNLSLALRELGDHEGALSTSLESHRLAQETGFRALVVTAMGTVAEAYLAKEDYNQAGSYLRQYLASARETASKRDETWAHILLGEKELGQKQLESARDHISHGLAIAQEVGLRSEQAHCHELLGRIYEHLGKLRSALEEMRLFVGVKETIFNEASARSMANLQVLHNVETAKKDAEIHYLRTLQLQREVEAHKRTELALEQLAATDPLTGVLNRRKFLALGEEATSTARRDNHPLSAILVDVDHFKAINDTHGHTSGDAALAAVAAVIRDNLRKGELVGRLGGDEFAVLLPVSDGAQATGIAQRIRQTISSLSFVSDGRPIRLQASLGVAQFDIERDTGVASLVDHADSAMYRAKRGGRNRVAVYESSGAPGT